jgi:hypothetical protein
VRQVPVENGAVPAAAREQDAPDDDSGPDEGDSPIVVRTKDHVASAMTLDQALYEMELVGHDWFLFVEAGSGLPSVVYRRRGWSYGMIRLQVDQFGAGAGAGAVAGVVAGVGSAALVDAPAG